MLHASPTQGIAGDPWTIIEAYAHRPCVICLDHAALVEAEVFYHNTNFQNNLPLLFRAYTASNIFAHL